jgi:MFS family permease
MRKELKLLVVADIVATMGIAIVGPVYMAATISASELGIAWFLYGFVTSSLGIPMGKLCNKLGKKKVLLIGSVVGALGAILSLFFVPPLQFYILEVLTGMAVAIQSPAWYSYLADLTKKKDRANVIGLYQSLTGYAWTFGILITALFLTSIKPEFVLTGSALLQLISSYIIVKA